MKQVIAILGGKRDGNTHNLLKYLEEILNQNTIDLEIIFLNEMNIEDCRGCENCVLGNGCILEDDMPKITEAIKKTDGIIIASPVYNNNISGKTKMFIDKTVKWSHSPILTSKPYLGLTTTSSSGLKFTLKYLTTVGVNWGTHPIGNIWASKRTTNMKKNKRVLAKFISALNQDPSKHRPTLNQIIQFQRKRVLAKTVFPNDFAYWNEKNWLNMPYYYKCKISPLKRLMGVFIHWMLLTILRNAIKKHQDKIGTKEYGKLIFE
ncbi:MAG: flavodoxin family protein [Candidatus Heimdallarchaeota archaeon]|nr:flavodoxin family protein [Candidatus Heimdallarchaeota archaeon]